MPHFLALPGLPPESWILTLVVLAILGVTALVDARTGLVPNLPLVIGYAALLVGISVYGDLIHTAQSFVAGLVLAALIWGINEIYFYCRKRDAIGMGDAKWSALAAACFGLPAMLIAWGLAAWLALLWIAAQSLLRQRRSLGQVYFAPFLFAGLMVALAGRALN